jgi:hypothetical protein
MDCLSRNEWLQSQVFIYVLLFVTAVFEGFSTFTLRLKSSLFDDGNEGTGPLQAGKCLPIDAA